MPVGGVGDQVAILARHHLENFPQDVFDDWISPLIADRGWPFLFGMEDTRQTDWANVFWKKSLRYWRNLRWDLVQVHLNELPLDPRSQDIAKAIVGHMQGFTTFGTSGPTESIEHRFKRAYWFIKKHHRLPRPVVVVAQADATWRLADGHHRIAAAIALKNENPIHVQAWIGFR